MSLHSTRLRPGGRRYAGVLAGLAVGAAAVLMPTGAASAGPGGLPPLPEDGGRFAVPYDKLPPGAVRATHGGFDPGPHGAVFQAALKPTTISPRVVGGTPANVADHPGVVGIQSRFLGREASGRLVWYLSTCTGTVISSTKVLTAAHCTVGLPFGTTWVIAGRNTIDIDSGGFVARVATTWTHQGFNLADVHSGAALVLLDDVSVLTLRDALPDAYRPVALSAQGDQTPYAAGTEATIVGYGVTDPGSNSAGILHEARVPMKSTGECVKTYGYLLDGARMVCAGNPFEGIDTCHGDSSGPIFVGDAQVGITDWGYDPCGRAYGVYEKLSYYAASINEDMGRQGLINRDWTGDGHSDLFGRYADGRLRLYTGSGLASDGFGGISYSTIKGTGWGGYTKVFRVHNWNGDGRPSIMARDKTGKLYLYRSDGWGNFAGSRKLIGTGWNAYTDIVATNNWMGDGRPNLLGRNAKGGLYVYSGNGKGGFASGRGTLIGVGWNMFNTVLAPGSWVGDGRQSLVGRRADGKLYLYTGNGKGGFASGRGTLIGTGWSMFKIIISPGDWNGDNMIDLIGIGSNGTVRLYTTNGKGRWLDGHGKRIASGWSGFNMAF